MNTEYRSMEYIYVFTTILVFGLLTPKDAKFVRADFPFRNPDLRWTERVQDLVSRLTLREKVLMLASGGGGWKPTPAIPRLGIDTFNWNTECIHGIVHMPGTAFPQAIGIAASFSKHLTEQMAVAIGYEARAFYNQAKKRGDYTNMKGINCFAPFVNVVHHPLWGRIQEVYGEDPYLSGQIAVAYISGLQNHHPRYIVASSGCKTVDVHSGPEDIPVSRFSFNAVVTERNMRLTFLPNMKSCIEAGTYHLMCSYNSINGTPACANKWLLKDILRDEFGFSGFVISDAGAIENIYRRHHFVNSTIEAAVAAAKAGVNLELPLSSANPAYLLLTEAVQKGMIAEYEITSLLKPLLYTRMRLGEFDPVEMNPFNSVNLSVVQSEQHRDVALQLAMQSFVLLKNDNNMLPLKAGFETLAVIGPMSNTLEQVYGNYQPLIMPEYAQTVFQGLSDSANVVNLVPGCENNHCNNYEKQREIVRAAVETADVVVLSLGTGIELEQEGHDRATLDLPAGQINLLQDVIAHGGDKPIVLLIFSGGPVNISIAKNNEVIKSIIQCFFPAQSTGQALRQVLFEDKKGAVVSPAARLPYTWYASVDQAGKITDYSMQGKTYRYFEGPGDPLYPFGYGMSYTTFNYSNMRTNSSTIKAGDGVLLKVDVTNIGKYDSDEVVQVYVRWNSPPEPMPKLQLVGFDRIHIKTGKTSSVIMEIEASAFMIWSDAKKWIYDIGDTVTVYVGGQQPGQTTKLASNVLQTTFNIVPADRFRFRDVMRNYGPDIL